MTELMGQLHLFDPDEFGTPDRSAQDRPGVMTTTPSRLESSPTPREGRLGISGCPNEGSARIHARQAAPDGARLEFVGTRPDSAPQLADAGEVVHEYRWTLEADDICGCGHGR